MTQGAFYRGLEAGDALLREVGPEDPVAAARRVHALAESAPGGGAAGADCRPGCAFCCHFPVGVSFPEVQALATAIRGLPLPRRIELRRRIERAALQTAPLPWKEQARGLHPCPLLDDDRTCAVHASRPLACRGWSSTSAPACEAAFLAEARGATPPRVPLLAEAHLLALGLGAALEGWSVRAGLPGAHRELHSALWALLVEEAAPDEAFRRSKEAGE